MLGVCVPPFSRVLGETTKNAVEISSIFAVFCVLKAKNKVISVNEIVFSPLHSPPRDTHLNVLLHRYTKEHYNHAKN